MSKSTANFVVNKDLDFIVETVGATQTNGFTTNSDGKISSHMVVTVGRDKEGKKIKKTLPMTIE